ncbi:MAG TPA: plastocyanin/azurin family copper-binding protein [Thermoleophilaceae bacterium]
MRSRTRGRLILAAAALGAVLALPAAPRADQAAVSDARVAPNRAPVAHHDAARRAVLTGGSVLLDASASRDPDGRIVRYLWDLNGDGVYETGTGAGSRLRDILATPGAVKVGLRVVDDRGAASEDHVRLRASTLADESLVSGGRAGAAGERLKAATNGGGGGKRQRTAGAALHAAAATTVTIQDFKFVPTSVSVSTGDTVTWTNQGKQPHSATAADGSFDTGLLRKGGSGSFRFTKAGTFSYKCTPHPFMKATVVVSGASSGSTPSSTGAPGAPGGGSGGGDSDSGGSSLPHTGLELGSLALAGMLLLAGGVALRRRLARGRGAGLGQ